MRSKSKLLAYAFCILVASLLLTGSSSGLASRPAGAPIGAGSGGYGYWQNLPGHPSVMYQLKCDNCDQSGSHMWWVRFKNDGPERVAFSFRIDVAGKTNVHLSDRVTIDPGKTQEGWNSVEGGGDAGGTTLVVYTANWKSGPDAQ